MIIPIVEEFKDSNQIIINNCFQSYHNMIPKIHRDDESYREGSFVACTYGLYNYNVNIGNKNLDPVIRIQVEGEAEICMFEDHCMKKINQIIKGKIALPQSSTPTVKDSRQSVPSPEILEYEKERKEAQKSTILEKLNEQPYTRQPYTTTDKQKNDDESKQKVINDQKEIQSKEDQRAVLFCTQYIHAVDQPQSCQIPR